MGVIEHLAWYHHKGFTITQVVQIAAHDGGSKNLKGVTQHHDTLSNLGFSQEQIVQIAGHDGGSKNIVAIIEHLQVKITVLSRTFAIPPTHTFHTLP